MRYWARWKSKLAPWPGPEKPDVASVGISPTDHFYQTYLHGSNAREVERRIRATDPNATELLVLLARMSGLR